MLLPNQKGGTPKVQKGLEDTSQQQSPDAVLRRVSHRTASQRRLYLGLLIMSH